MKCWAVVPVKRLSAAKSRLAPQLSLRERDALMCEMLAHTLAALKGVRGIRGKIVVGRDRAVRRIAADHGAVFVREKDRDGLNRALARAAREAVRRGADALIVVPADLPLLAAGDIVWALKQARGAPFLAIAPDRSGRGTNLLIVSPPRLIRFSFGPRSRLRHIQAARRVGVREKILLRRSLAWDLDRPEDLERMIGWRRIGRPTSRRKPLDPSFCPHRHADSAS